ncbi:GAF domain-containing protein [Candidatus Poribacteria bacterium]|nr:GAF domain-containing protein [Candidatus Poribacteria bacterium]
MPARIPDHSSRLERLEVLYKVSNILNTTQDPQRVLKAVLKEVVRITAATSGSIAMLDRQRGVLVIKTAINIPAATWKRLKLELGVGVTGWVAYKGKPVRVDDVRRDSHYVAIKPDIRSELAVPMFLHGRLIGVINVDSTRTAAFTETDEKLLMAVAEQSARVIETAGLYEQLRTHAQQIESIYELGRKLTTEIPLEAIPGLIAQEGRRLLEADASVLLDCPARGGGLPILAAEGYHSGGDESAFPESLVAPILREGGPLRLGNLRAASDAQSRWNGWSGGMGALLGVPAVYHGEMLAILMVLHESPREYTSAEIKLLQLLANQGAVALESARRQERLLSTEQNMHRVERFSLLGTLAAEIAHEIRNPVTIINLLLHSIAEESKGNKQVSADLAIVREKIDRIERIVGQTLGIARNQEPEFESASLNDVIADLILFVNRKLSKAGIEIRTALEDSLPAVWMDRGQIQQVLLNLVMNAIEAMPPGGRIVLRTGLAEEDALGRCAVVSIQDSGKGIPPHHLDDLFKPFFTTRDGGTGLGLFISQKLVAGHRGALRVKSAEGKGSTFTVLLPLDHQEGEPKDAAHPGGG